MDTSSIFEWAGTISALAGAYLLANQKRSGFLIHMIGNIALGVFSLAFHHYGLLFLQVAFLGINIMGLKKWKNNESALRNHE